MTDKELDDLTARVSEALDVPEPSPLFWEHFPGRVRAAVQSAPAPRLSWWKRPALGIALSVAIVGSLSYAAWSSRAASEDQPADAAPIETVDSLIGVALEPGAIDEGWEVVTDVAATAGIDAVREAGFGVAPGDADAAVEAMTDAERAQLAALLQAELNGDVSGGS